MQVAINCSVIHRHMALKNLKPIQMQLDDVLYEEIFDSLSEEKQAELIGRKADFAKKAGINS